MAISGARILSVNVGQVREFEFNGRPAKSGIWKAPVVGRVTARGVNLEGDDQADRKAHGGPDKAIYAYAVEDLRWWEQELGRSLPFGGFGENLTTERIALNDTLVGERWTIGTTILEVSEPRIPCWRLGVRMNDNMFPRRFTEALRPGTYLRIVVEGDVGAGDEIRSVYRPDHDLTVRDVFRIYTRDRDEAAPFVESHVGERRFLAHRGVEDQMVQTAEALHDALGLEQCAGHGSPASQAPHEAEDALGRAGITLNKNAIPNDPQKPTVTSGIRIGTPAMTTRGLREAEAERLAHLVADVLEDPSGDATARRVAGEVKALCRRFPVYA